MAKNLWLKGCAAAAVMIFVGAVPLSAQMFEDAAVPTAEENQRLRRGLTTAGLTLVGRRLPNLQQKVWKCRI